jgi:hypothetical protein
VRHVGYLPELYEDAQSEKYYTYTVTSINLSILLENPEMANSVGSCFLFRFFYLHSIACRKREMGRGQANFRRTKQIITLTIHLQHHIDSKVISLFHEQSSTVLANGAEWLILQDTKKISEHVCNTLLELFTRNVI